MMPSDRESERLQILVIEDVDAMRHLLVQVLEGIPGFVVSGAARNTAEARLELTRRRPQLILLDEVLPSESSIDLLKSLTAQELPVLLMTSMAEDSSSRQLPSGALGRFQKPDWDTLEQDRDRIRQLIQSTWAAFRRDRKLD